MFAVCSDKPPDHKSGQYGCGKLAQEKPPEISLDTKGRDDKKYAGNSNQKTNGIDEKSAAGFAQAIDNTGKCAVGVEEGTDPCQGKNKSSGIRTLEQCDSDPGAEQEKKEAAE